MTLIQLHHISTKYNYYFLQSIFVTEWHSYSRVSPIMSLDLTTSYLITLFQSVLCMYLNFDCWNSIVIRTGLIDSFGVQDTKVQL